MLRPIKLRVQYSKLEGGSRFRIVGDSYPVLSWGAYTDQRNAFQTAYKVIVTSGDKLLWDTGFIKSSEQFVRYAGVPLPVGVRINFAVTLMDGSGEASETAEDYFYYGKLQQLPQSKWITASRNHESVPVYFRKTFVINEKPQTATLFICGLGYHQATLNGERVDDSHLDPAFSNYKKRCYYTVIPELEQKIQCGKNVIGVVVADGWRRNNGAYLHGRSPEFFGIPCLWAALRIVETDGTEKWILSDDSWKWGRGAITYSHLFHGETYDAAQHIPEWNISGFDENNFQNVEVQDQEIGKLYPMTLEPIVGKNQYEPISIIQVKRGVYLVDFGQNIAGVIRLKIPKGLPAGHKIIIEHMEFLKEDGTLYMENLRTAKAKDTYIAAGKGADLDEWQPNFVYHGFRYVQVTGIDLLEKQSIRAVDLHTDLDTKSRFACGSPIINQIQDMIMRTERANMHSLMTDCPQRDERMGWMNDATVRFEETPYNFEIGRMFPKVIWDVEDTQDETGAITCTAPFIYGRRPADPVCSAHLIAGVQAFLHTGNIDIISQAYPGYCAWQKFLETQAENHIVNYSYYGDWAAPAYACDPNSRCDGAVSDTVPGAIMSTGYYYYNAKLLAYFSKLLHKDEETAYYTELGYKIQKAFLNKWYDPQTGAVAGGTQGCQAFALWLDILPEDGRAKAAKLMRDDLVQRKYQFTTGNICTRYLCDMLAAYGYVDELYALLTKETYPSLGFMIQNEATTLWERFELKKHTGMNSHNHAMYGAIGYCFYAYLAGIIPKDKAFSRVEIKPCYPKKLLSVNTVLDTVKGELTVRWVKQFGKCHLYVNIPFNVIADIHIPEGIQACGSGFWHFEWDVS